LAEVVEALVFLDVLALGFRTSRFERFWPLAIQVSEAERVRGPSGARAHAQPQCILRGQGSTQAPLCTILAIQLVVPLPLNSEGIGLELACYGEKRGRAELCPGISREPAAGRCLFAQLVRRLVA
jgi:hypothetical protein